MHAHRRKGLTKAGAVRLPKLFSVESLAEQSLDALAQMRWPAARCQREVDRAAFRGVARQEEGGGTGRGCC